MIPQIKKTTLVSLFSLFIFQLNVMGQNMPDNVPESLKKVLENHNWAQWRQHKSLHFSVNSDEGTDEEHYIDLQERLILVDKPGAFKIGMNRHDVWIYPGEDKAPTGSARFYAPLWFYFFSMPMVFADEGIVYQALDDMVVNGEKYAVVDISFNDAVGDSPKDQYRLFIDTNKQELSFVAYAVSFFDKQQHPLSYAIRFDQWQRQNGVLVPVKVSGYEWGDNSFGKKTYDQTFSNIQFSEHCIPHFFFEKPGDAVAVQ